MNCSNCGANINNGQSFCAVCGTRVVSQPADYLSNNNTYQTGGQFFNNYGGEINNEQLLDEYIGKNAEQIKREGNKSISFSPFVFLFGVFYSVYRKMYILAALQFLVLVIASIFLPSFAVIISGAVNWIVILQFNKWYLKNAKENVEKIKNENMGMPQQNLIEICRRKGGTSIPVLIITIICYLIIVIGSTFLTMENTVIEDEWTYNNDIVEQQYVENDNKLNIASSEYFEGYFSSVPKPKVDNTWTEKTASELEDWSTGDNEAYTLLKEYVNDDETKIQPKFDEYEKQLKAFGFTFYEESFDHYTYIKGDIAVQIFAGYDYLSVDLSSGYQAPHM